MSHHRRTPPTILMSIKSIKSSISRRVHKTHNTLKISAQSSLSKSMTLGKTHNGTSLTHSYRAMAITLHLSSHQPPHQPSLFFPSTNTPTTLISFIRTSKPSHRLHRNQIFLPRIPSSSFRSGSNTPSETECPVPLEQQPINEYQNLSTSFPFSWAAGDFVEYCSRLFVTGASFALLVGLPVAWLGAPSPESEPLKCVLGAASSGIVVVTLAVVRMYLGWAYVGNRLLSATVEYEETGWYDGQVWVKTAEVLARDRLLGSFSVKPVLGKLKYTLVTLAVSLFICVFLLINIDESQKASNKSFEANRERVIPGVYSDESARSFEPDAFCGEPGIPRSVD